ncbi:MAG: prepilin-type N-terminal cleavage/methylation domain-containing protein [Deltaproteobacteria bacterium]
MVKIKKQKGYNSTLYALRSTLDHKGFTLIELIIVIILAGILVAAIAVRISLTPSQTANITAVDQAVADIQYVQMLALGNRSNRSIVFTSGSAVYTIQNSSGVTIETKTLPSGTTAGTSVTFTFNSLGELTGGSDQTLSLGGRTITVYRITGKVSAP